MTPEEIEQKVMLPEEKKALFHSLYEQARYGNEECSKEDAEQQIQRAKILLKTIKEYLITQAMGWIKYNDVETEITWAEKDFYPTFHWLHSQGIDPWPG